MDPSHRFFWPKIWSFQAKKIKLSVPVVWWVHLLPNYSWSQIFHSQIFLFSDFHSQIFSFSDFSFSDFFISDFHSQIFSFSNFFILRFSKLHQILMRELKWSQLPTYNIFLTIAFSIDIISVKYTQQTAQKWLTLKGLKCFNSSSNVQFLAMPVTKNKNKNWVHNIIQHAIIMESQHRIWEWKNLRMKIWE